MQMNPGRATIMYKKVMAPAVTGLLVITIIVAAVAFSSRGALAKSGPSNVQVNQVFAGPFPTNKQNEPSLAQNPTNLLNLISGSNDEIGEPACTNTAPSSCPFVAGVQSSGFYASFDGGQTWPCQGLIDLSAFHEYSFGDPSQAFDSKGNGNDQILFSRSTDGGKTWSPALHLSPAHNNNSTGGRQGAAVKVGPDGTIFLTWLDSVDKQSVQLLRVSHDGGA